MELFSLLHLNQKSFKTPYKIGDSLSPDQAMEAAIFEGYKGLGFVSPNPLVGSAILNSEGRLLSLGYHRSYGKEHAEIHAIKKIIPSLSSYEIKVLAQNQSLKSLKKNKEIQRILKKFSILNGAHLFLTLEPCSFRGHQESCAKILSKLPLASITFGILDPHPKVLGRGVKILKASKKNIKMVTNSKIIKQIKELTEVFLYNIKYKRAFVALKIATSLDGKIALQGLKKSNQNLFFNPKKKEFLKKTWITNVQARKYSHFLRGNFDATLIGVNTLLIDNPRLDIRHPLFPNKKNKVIVLDPMGKSLKVLSKLNLSLVHKPKNIFIAVSKKHFLNQEKTKYNLLYCPLAKNSLSNGSLLLDLDFLNQELFKRSIMSLYVEGGASVHSSYFRQFQWQKVYQFLSPLVLGSQFLPWIKDIGSKNIKQGIKLQNIKLTHFKDNLLISGTHYF